jgi:predicted esterase
MYNLACYYVLDAQSDAAIYWLQRAALEEGVDASWALRDADLASLRGDPRWGAIRDFLVHAREYWVGRALKETLVAVPTGYTKGRPIPVIVALHGFGSEPGDFGGPWAQRQADGLDVAIVSASGTLSLGPHSFRWTESAARDEARVDEALAAASERVTIAEGQIVLIGFSQGAQMGAEIAARRPSRFAGAIAMSPGTLAERNVETALGSNDLAKQRFVVVAGAGENPTIVAQVRSDAARLRALGADVFDKTYAGMIRHAFPPDFGEAMPRWIRFVLGSGPRP